MRPETMDSDHVSILLDIKEQIGAMGAQLHEAARTRERLEDGVKGLYGKIEAVDRRTGVIENQHADIIKPLVRDVARLKLLTGKFTAIWGAGFAVIAWALSYFSNEIHTFFFPGRHP
jgi:hypothetical protein